MAKDKIPTMTKAVTEAAEQIKKPKNLFDIIETYYKLAVELELGEVTDELYKEYMINQEEMQDKLLGYKYIISANNSKKDYYKEQIELLSSRISKLDKINERLKENVCIAVDAFGTNGKYTSTLINVSSVHKEVLDVNDDVLTTELNEIYDAIAENKVADLEYELDLVKSVLTIEASPEVLTHVIDNLTNMEEANEIKRKLTVSLDRKSALEYYQMVKAQNDGIDAQIEAQKRELQFDDTKSEVPEKLTIAFKSISTKDTIFPRWS